MIAYYPLVFGAPPPIDPFDGGGHGTNTAGCAAGDTFRVLAARAGTDLDDPLDDEDAAPASQAYGIGIDHHQDLDGSAPGAQLVIQDDQSFRNGVQEFWWENHGLCEVLVQAYDTPPGVRVQGCQLQFGPRTDYTEYCREVDLEAWARRDLVVTRSAGNGGHGPLSLDGWANSKNALVVGGTRAPADGSGGVADGLFGLDTDLVRSSHGPGFPDRIKPDLVGPGTLRLVLPTAATGADGCGGTAVDSGTSFAAPWVSGLAANVRQYFREGYYPGGSPDPVSSLNPTNALVRAVLINSTRNLTGTRTADDGRADAAADRPTHGQGWGAVVADDTLFFAGDPVLPGERPRLIVLNDVPNGLTDTSRINDSRGAILDTFRPTLGEEGGRDRIHEYDVYVPGGSDFHATLAWTDPPGRAAGLDANDHCPGGCPENTGAHPLVNDLDLEIVGPDGTVWRPRPGSDGAVPASATADPMRLWAGGYSQPRPASGDVPCPAGCSTCPPGSFEAAHEQAADFSCDFRGRDASNNVENVFMRASQIVEGWHRVRAIGFRVPGNCWSGIPAYPNFVDPAGPADPEPTDHDIISDRDQGYALVVSGAVSTRQGILAFGQHVARCGETARVTLTDEEVIGPNPTVRIETAIGDCDEFPLVAVPGGLAAVFPVADADDGTPSCGPGPGDGIVVTGDDAMLVATYQDGSRIVRATTRVACRDVSLESVAVADGCDAGVGNAALNPEEAVILTISVRNATARAVDDLRGELFSFHDDVEVLGMPSMSVLPGPVGTVLTMDVPVVMRAGGPCGPGETRRFRLEIRGEHGFRDRLYFEVPVACTPGTGLASYLPGEVAPVLLPGGTDALTVTKASALANTNLKLKWPNDPVGTRYDVWRGTIASLHEGVFDHEVGLGGPCDLAENASGETENTFVGDGEPGVPNLYYLVSAEATCGTTGPHLKGPVGFGNHDRDRSTRLMAERRPHGWIRRAGCLP